MNTVVWTYVCAWLRELAAWHPRGISLARISQSNVHKVTKCGSFIAGDRRENQNQLDAKDFGPTRKGPSGKGEQKDGIQNQANNDNTYWDCCADARPSIQWREGARLLTLTQLANARKGRKRRCAHTRGARHEQRPALPAGREVAQHTPFGSAETASKCSRPPRTCDDVSSHNKVFSPIARWDATDCTWLRIASGREQGEERASGGSRLEFLLCHPELPYSQYTGEGRYSFCDGIRGSSTRGAHLLLCIQTIKQRRRDDAREAMRNKLR